MVTLGLLTCARRHVFRDLRPYVCTAGSCSDPDRQFATRYDWIYHEKQLHHRQWDCSECRDVFENRGTFQAHIAVSHGAEWTERQISILCRYAGTCQRRDGMVSLPTVSIFDVACQIARAHSRAPGRDIPVFSTQAYDIERRARRDVQRGTRGFCFSFVPRKRTRQAIRRFVVSLVQFPSIAYQAYKLLGWIRITTSSINHTGLLSQS